MILGRPEVMGFDDFGFAIFSEGSIHASDDQRCHVYSCHGVSHDDVISLQDTWSKLEGNFGRNGLVSPQKLRSFIKQGIPSALRGELWQLLVGSKLLKRNTAFAYEDKLGEVRKILVDCGVTEYDGRNTARIIGKLVGSFVDDETAMFQRVHLEDDVRNKLTAFRQALLDAGRTFPSHKMFMEGTTSGKEGRAALFRILAVYILYNPKVSYCQGMSYIGGMLLMQMSEEDAFWMLVSLFERPKYLSGYFDSSLSKIQRHAQVFEKLLSQKMPRLYNHLKIHDVDPLLYITPWFMALFTSLPCWDSVLTIWDLLLFEGIPVIFQASLAILRVISDQLFALRDISQILPVLLRLPAQRMYRSHFVEVLWRWTIYSWEVEAVLAIVSDVNNTNGQVLDPKRKLPNDANVRARKIPRRTMDTSVTNKESHSLSLFQKVTTFFSSFLSKPLKENNSTPINAAITQNKTGFPAFSAASSITRSGSRRRCHRRVEPNDDSRLLQQLCVKSPQEMKLNVYSGNGWVSGSPNTWHAFRMFNTPTPLRPPKMTKTSAILNNINSQCQPQFSLSPDVELQDL